VPTDNMACSDDKLLLQATVTELQMPKEGAPTCDRVALNAALDNIGRFPPEMPEVSPPYRQAKHASKYGEFRKLSACVWGLNKGCRTSCVLHLLCPVPLASCTFLDMQTKMDWLGGAQASCTQTKIEAFDQFATSARAENRS